MLSRLDTDIENCRRQNMHTRHCNSLAPQPKQQGFQYDVYIIMHCDCLLSIENPTEQEKIAFLRKIAEVYPWPHDKTCPALHPKWEKYRGAMVSVRMNCTCWLSQLDKPTPAPYTEPMTIPEEQAVLSEIKRKIDQTVGKALGPHLDTPIYDQLAREYDKRYNNMNFFDTELSKRLQQMGHYNR